MLCYNILCYFMYFMWYFVGLRCTIICQLSLTLRLSLLFLPIGVLPDALWYPIYAFLLYRQSAFYILHNNTHLLTLLLAPRHCLYLLRRTPKHTAITFVPPLPKHHLYLNTKLTALTFSNNNMSTRRTFELGYDEVSTDPATPPKSVCGPCAHGRHGSCERVCCQCPQ